MNSIYSMIWCVLVIFLNINLKYYFNIQLVIIIKHKTEMWYRRWMGHMSKRLKHENNNKSLGTFKHWKWLWETLYPIYYIFLSNCSEFCFRAHSYIILLFSIVICFFFFKNYYKKIKTNFWKVSLDHQKLLNNCVLLQ